MTNFSEALDVAILGGSFAGLTAALQLGRASRSVVVFDTGSPRNAASPAAHGVPDGTGGPRATSWLPSAGMWRPIQPSRFTTMQ